MARLSNAIFYRGIKLGKDYRDVCDNVSRETLSPYAAAQFDNLSVIRMNLEGGEVSVQAQYSTLIECPYMSFQNQGYSWNTFYAFVDAVEWVGENTTRVTFTIDQWSTYKIGEAWQPNNCFVLREHPADDSIGANLLWEDVGVTNNWVKVKEAYEDFSTYNYRTWYTKETIATDDMPIIDNVLSATPVTGPDPAGATRDLIQQYVNTGHEDKIIDIQAVPTNSTNAMGMEMSGTLDGYTPKWNKLYTAQFNKFILTDMQGNTVELYREYSSSAGIGINFHKADGNTTAVQAIPANYNGYDEDYSNSITLTGFPKVSWQGNSYAQWMAQNGTANAMGQVASSVMLLNGIIAKNPTSIVGGALGMLGSVNQREVAQQVGSNAYGSVNSTSVLAAYNALGIYLIQVSQPADFLKSADDYFTRYGYRTDKLKVPRTSGNSRQNYIQVADDLANGIPVPAARAINDAARRGMTIWHDLSYIGEY